MRNTGIIYGSGEKTPVVLPEMETLLPPLSEEQASILKVDLLANGCYSPIIVNEELAVIDGHNRLTVCREHDIPFQMLVFSFKDMLEAKQWALDTQKGRRNLTIWELGNIALKLKSDLEARAKENLSACGGNHRDIEPDSPPLMNSSKVADPVNTRKEMAQAVGISEQSMGRIAQIDEHGPDTVKEALEKHEISLNQGYNITRQVQDLPEEDREQAAADLIEEQYKKSVQKLDADLARKERISRLFCTAYEKAALLEATEDNVRAWVECTRMTPAEMSDTVVDSLNLSQVFRDIAGIMQTKILPSDWRCANENS